MAPGICGKKQEDLFNFMVSCKHFRDFLFSISDDESSLKQKIHLVPTL